MTTPTPTAVFPDWLSQRGFSQGRDGGVLATLAAPFADFLAFDQQGLQSEWVDGEIRVYMSNSPQHQRILGFLHLLLAGFAEVRNLGSVFTAGLAIEPVPGGSSREPDMVFVAAAHLDRVRDSHLHGAPDLVIEIVSRDSVHRDYEEKFLEYEAAGIPEYWIIEARPGREQASFFQLADGKYVPVPLDDEGMYVSGAITGLAFPVVHIFDPQARAMAVLNEALQRPPA